MSEIDWSKAPEGATHYHAPNKLFYCYVADVLMVFRDGKWNQSHLLDHSRMNLIPRPSPAWSGEGLPPVGCECEVLNQTLYNPKWERCTILFVGKFKCVYESESCHERVADVDGPLQFRPIRTPEQIAAEEREKACEEMLRIAKSRRTDPDVYEAIATLYDAGYRKQEAAQ